MSLLLTASHSFRPVSVSREPTTQWRNRFPFRSTASQIQHWFFGTDIGVHFIHFDDFNASSRMNGLNGLAMRLDPVIDGNMAAFQKPAN
jgi:hypothetical protein